VSPLPVSPLILSIITTGYETAGGAREEVPLTLHRLLSLVVIKCIIPITISEGDGEAVLSMGHDALKHWQKGEPGENKPSRDFV